MSEKICKADATIESGGKVYTIAQLKEIIPPHKDGNPLTIVRIIAADDVLMGARGLSEDKVLYYNLDAIISVGYKINSVQATKFRIWSTSILREYMRH
ncbi:MAG: virulence RhuM family protein, partial [Bacteroidales bacterium]|nr:virulence RhuM family protein [Bacteroidales bacterium]